jgi:hypothetical protein
VETEPKATAPHLDSTRFLRRPLFATLENLQAALVSGDSANVSAMLTPLEGAAEQVRTMESSLGNISANG